MIPEQFRAVTCPEPTPEQYAAVKLEAGMRSGVKKFKRDQKAGKLSSMENDALGNLVKSTNNKNQQKVNTSCIPKIPRDDESSELCAARIHAKENTGHTSRDYTLDHGASSKM